MTAQPAQHQHQHADTRNAAPAASVASEALDASEALAASSGNARPEAAAAGSSSEAAPIRVLLVDDHAIMRTGFRMILQAAGMQVVGEAATGSEAVAAASALLPDVICMDVQMPDMDGLEATRRIVADRGVTAAVLIVTTFDRDDYLFAALAAGASGFLLKNAGPEDLVSAVRVVASGDALLAPEVTRRVIERFAADSPAASAGEPGTAGGGTDSSTGRDAGSGTGSGMGGDAGSGTDIDSRSTDSDAGSGTDSRSDGSGSASAGTSAPSPPPLAGAPAHTRDAAGPGGHHGAGCALELREPFTDREAEVLTLLAQALSNAEIAEHLFIGEATVKTHVSKVLQKLGARDRVQAVVFAHRNGLA